MEEVEKLCLKQYNRFRIEVVNNNNTTAYIYQSISKTFESSEVIVNGKHQNLIFCYLILLLTLLKT